MKLFISNCTRSHWALNLRFPEGKAIRIGIPSGHQRPFPVDLNQEQLENVIGQVEKLGGRPRVDTHGKLNKFTGLIYSTDKPLNEKEIKGAHEDQIDHAQNRSVAQATRSALAADLNWTDEHKPRGKRRAKTVGVSVSKKDSERGTEVPMMDIEISESGSTREKLPI